MRFRLAQQRFTRTSSAALRWVQAGALAACLSAATAWARDAGPIRIPLDELGYTSQSSEFMVQGGAMLTVHFVDPRHLLVTFGVRRLMKRDEQPATGDDDRTVGAFLLELPSGKVLAHTEWRLHDRGQYLWDLGGGRFLLRIKDDLKVIAPMQAADPKDAFQQQNFLKEDSRRIVAILISAEADLLTVETTEQKAAVDAPVDLNFYRLVREGARLVVQSAGTVRARQAIALPLTSSGFLEVLEGGRGRWLFNFDSHGGKVSQLADFTTTCFPHVTFVSRSEFVAFGCKGGPDKQDLAGFSLRGDEMWQQSFYDTHIAPVFAYAPSAGRFALGRMLLNSGADLSAPATPESVTGQDVRVYQTYSGKILLRLQCTPVERTGQNFTLSPDGMQLAVVREELVRHPGTKFDPGDTVRTGVVEVYDLPPLSAKDQAAVKQVYALAPVDGGERIDASLKRISAPATPAAPSTATAAQPESPPPAIPSAATPDPLPASSPTPSSTSAIAVGDVPLTGPRKPPTLYSPDERPANSPSSSDNPENARQ